MNNTDRIDEILRESDLLPLNYSKFKAARKAMEQYGKEMYEDGKTDMLDILEHQEALHTPRLQLLAKLQKEYIELLTDRYAGLLTVAAPHGYQESRESIEKGIKLRVQIKTLEQ